MRCGGGAIHPCESFELATAKGPFVPRLQPQQPNKNQKEPGEVQRIYGGVGGGMRLVGKI